MGIKAVAVGELYAAMDVAEFGTKGRGAGHGGVNMQPEVVLTADAGNFGYGIDGVGGSSADGRTDETGNQASSLVLRDLAGEGIRTKREVAVYRDGAQVVGSDACNFGGFFYGRVRLGRSIGNQFAVTTPGIGGKTGGALATGQQGAEGRTGSRVLNDAAA